MIRSKRVVNNSLVEMDNYKSLGAAIRDVRARWHTWDGPLTVLLVDDLGWNVATLVRDPAAHEKCSTLYADGTPYMHMCREGGAVGDAA